MPTSFPFASTTGTCDSSRLVHDRRDVFERVVGPIVSGCVLHHLADGGARDLAAARLRGAHLARERNRDAEEVDERRTCTRASDTMRSSSRSSPSSLPVAVDHRHRAVLVRRPSRRRRRRSPDRRAASRPSASSRHARAWCPAFSPPRDRGPLRNASSVGCSAPIRSIATRSGAVPAARAARPCTYAPVAAARGVGAVREQPADDAGQHVAGSGGRERRVSVRLTTRARRRRDHGARPFSTTIASVASASSRAAAMRSSPTGDPRAARTRPRAASAPPAAGRTRGGRAAARGRPRARSARRRRRRPGSGLRRPTAAPRPARGRRGRGPGPIASAAEALMSFDATPAASSSRRRRSVAGRARVTISPPDAAAAASCPGKPHTTMPAPARAPACAAISGAPVMPFEPPNTSRPDDHLCADASRRGRRRSSTSGTNRLTRAELDADVDDGARARRGPARVRTASRACGATNVMVSSASTAAPRDLAGRAVDARRDVDRERPRAPLAAPSPQSTRPHPSSAPRKPVPNIASTNRSARASARSNSAAVDPVGDREHVDPDAAPRSSRAAHPARRRRCCPCPHATTTRRP